FLAALHADAIINPNEARYANWHTQRAKFESIRAQAFTPSHALRYSHIEPKRMFWAMFMHGGLMHIFGNMLFLLALGLLVEGALGSGWYLGLYLLGGLVADSASLALHWGEQGLMLGASGAIAALMGAYCVLWGLRKVRVFYWFFIVFDYAWVPALALLPVWFGWQIFKLLSTPEAHVAFGAHAAGIACGALMALALRRSGRVRHDFIEYDEREQAHVGHDADYAAAMTHLGRLEIGRARQLLEVIDADEPGQLRVLAGLYRCARYAGKPDQLDAAATRLFGFAATTHAEADELKTLHDDYLKACSGLSRLEPTVLLRLVNVWMRLGQVDAAQAVLVSLETRVARLPALAAAWFALALRAPEASGERRTRLDYLAQHFPHSPYAAKARFLLQQS
ncbi:MAG: rhomboid family intramembrane serine protease, partial [Xanthomonadales bacterium]|nr:rhomboid family intramembrane serine protease [Xanthomonadales bacterium]